MQTGMAASGFTAFLQIVLPEEALPREDYEFFIVVFPVTGVFIGAAEWILSYAANRWTSSDGPANVKVIKDTSSIVAAAKGSAKRSVLWKWLLNQLNCVTDHGLIGFVVSWGVARWGWVPAGLVAYLFLILPRHYFLSAEYVNLLVVAFPIVGASLAVAVWLLVDHSNRRPPRAGAHEPT
jgi:hypothetical protein